MIFVAVAITAISTYTIVKYIKWRKGRYFTIDIDGANGNLIFTARRKCYLDYACLVTPSECIEDGDFKVWLGPGDYCMVSPGRFDYGSSVEIYYKIEGNEDTYIETHKI